MRTIFQSNKYIKSKFDQLDDLQSNNYNKESVLELNSTLKYTFQIIDFFIFMSISPYPIVYGCCYGRRTETIQEQVGCHIFSVPEVFPSCLQRPQCSSLHVLLH